MAGLVRAAKIRFAMVIEPMRAEDWPAVRAIYEEGIETGDATFDTEAPDWEAWDRDHLKSCRLVARDDGEVRGWAALSPVAKKDAYRGVAEVSLYVGAEARGTGIGRALGAELVEASEQAGIWTLESWIFPENEVSLALCESFGFRLVGFRERAGKVHGRWRDVVIVERRSKVVGVSEGNGR
jgi:L-amino acid N-acyltransferase YncA